MYNSFDELDCREHPVDLHCDDLAAQEFVALHDAQLLEVG